MAGDRCPDTHQWSIYLLDVNKGALPIPPVVGDLSPTSARMEQSFSVDGGKTWETNWICELTRPAPN